MDKEEINRLQKEHMDRIKGIFDEVQKAKGEKTVTCLHDQCEHCHGTGLREDGTQCVHFISCPCPKCSPLYNS